MCCAWKLAPHLNATVSFVLRIKIITNIAHRISHYIYSSLYAKASLYDRDKLWAKFSSIRCADSAASAGARNNAAKLRPHILSSANIIKSINFFGDWGCATDWMQFQRSMSVGKLSNFCSRSLKLALSVFLWLCVCVCARRKQAVPVGEKFLVFDETTPNVWRATQARMSGKCKFNRCYFCCRERANRITHCFPHVLAFKLPSLTHLSGLLCTFSIVHYVPLYDSSAATLAYVHVSIIWNYTCAGAYGE